jgi:hypothetical protein
MNHQLTDVETLNRRKEPDPIIERDPSDFGGGSPRNKLLSLETAEPLLPKVSLSF